MDAETERIHIDQETRKTLSLVKKEIAGEMLSRARSNREFDPETMKIILWMEVVDSLRGIVDLLSEVRDEMIDEDAGDVTEVGDDD